MPTLQTLDDTSSQTDTNHHPPKSVVSESDYWEKYYHDPEMTYEWNNGELEEKAMSDFITYLMYKWFFELLEHYLRTKPIAKTVGLNIGFRLVLPHKITIRRPDLGVVLNNNPVPLSLDDKSYKGTFDLCVEAISDSSKADIERDTISKKNEYAAGGVKEYYILDGHSRYTAFYRLNAQRVYAPIKPVKEDIIKSMVLPGFQFRIGDLYHRPSIEEMIDDPVYQEFVLPGYRQAKQQAEVEALARYQAEQRAEQQRLRADKFAEQLRALGINPDDLL